MYHQVAEHSKLVQKWWVRYITLPTACHYRTFNSLLAIPQCVDEDLFDYNKRIMTIATTIC